jgi:hypothetical protein
MYMQQHFYDLPVAQLAFASNRMPPWVQYKYIAMSHAHPPFHRGFLPQPSIERTNRMFLPTIRPTYIRYPEEQRLDDIVIDIDHSTEYPQSVVLEEGEEFDPYENYGCENLMDISPQWWIDPTPPLDPSPCTSEEKPEGPSPPSKDPEQFDGYVNDIEDYLPVDAQHPISPLQIGVFRTQMQKTNTPNYDPVDRDRWVFEYRIRVWAIYPFPEDRNTKHLATGIHGQWLTMLLPYISE